MRRTDPFLYLILLHILNTCTYSRPVGDTLEFRQKLQRDTGGTRARPRRRQLWLRYAPDALQLMRRHRN